MIVESKYISFGAPWDKYLWCAEASDLGISPKHCSQWPHRLVVIKDDESFVFESDTFNRDFDGDLTSVDYVCRVCSPLMLRVYND